MLLIEPGELARLQVSEPVRVVDVGDDDQRYQRAHIPGAVHMPYAELLAPQGPAKGLPPDAATLAGRLARLGIDDSVTVVAYDGDGGGKAARLLWSLDLLGHPRHGLLNGGFQAWLAEEGAVASGAEAAPEPGAGYEPGLRGADRLADRDWVRERLEDPGVILLDARSRAEYTGEDVRAERGGHIPGAVHLDWQALMDPEDPPALLPAEQIHALLEARGIRGGGDQEIVVHCQTHHRSSLTYAVLRALGYEHVRAYAGSWSEWGNDPELPVRTGPEP